MDATVELEWKLESLLKWEVENHMEEEEMEEEKEREAMAYQLYTVVERVQPYSLCFVMFWGPTWKSLLCS